jgi:hypothetical protein
MQPGREPQLMALQASVKDAAQFVSRAQELWSSLDSGRSKIELMDGRLLERTVVPRQVGSRRWAW